MNTAGYETVNGQTPVGELSRKVPPEWIGFSGGPRTGMTFEISLRVNSWANEWREDIKNSFAP